MTWKIHQHSRSVPSLFETQNMTSLSRLLRIASRTLPFQRFPTSLTKIVAKAAESPRGSRGPGVHRLYHVHPCRICLALQARLDGGACSNGELLPEILRLHHYHSTTPTIAVCNQNNQNFTKCTRWSYNTMCGSGVLVVAKSSNPGNARFENWQFQLHHKTQQYKKYIYIYVYAVYLQQKHWQSNLSPWEQQKKKQSPGSTGSLNFRVDSWKLSQMKGFTAKYIVTTTRLTKFAQQFQGSTRVDWIVIISRRTEDSIVYASPLFIKIQNIQKPCSMENL